jgi:hypothetical protein
MIPIPAILTAAVRPQLLLDCVQVLCMEKVFVVGIDLDLQYPMPLAPGAHSLERDLR